MSITPIPKPLPVDLKVIKSLIDERLIETKVYEEQIDEARSKMNEILEEIVILQDKGKVLLGMNPDEKEPTFARDPQTGARIKEKDNNKIKDDRRQN